MTMPRYICKIINHERVDVAFHVDLRSWALGVGVERDPIGRWLFFSIHVGPLVFCAGATTRVPNMEA